MPTPSIDTMMIPETDTTFNTAHETYFPSHSSFDDADPQILTGSHFTPLGSRFDPNCQKDIAPGLNFFKVKTLRDLSKHYEKLQRELHPSKDHNSFEAVALMEEYQNVCDTKEAYLKARLSTTEMDLVVEKLNKTKILTAKGKSCMLHAFNDPRNARKFLHATECKKMGCMEKFCWDIMAQNCLGEMKEVLTITKEKCARVECEDI